MLAYSHYPKQPCSRAVAVPNVSRTAPGHTPGVPHRDAFKILIGKWRAAGETGVSCYDLSAWSRSNFWTLYLA